MTRYIALLRGINVGGNTKIVMADLRALVESLGFTEVSTYIASGNVILTGADVTPDAVADSIQSGVESELGPQIRVIVRSADELAGVIAADPYPDAAADRAFVGFLDAEPEPAAIDRLTAVEWGEDEFRVIGRTVHLHCPNGIGRSKLAEQLAKGLGVTMTTRNMRTVRKLLELASN